MAIHLITGDIFDSFVEKKFYPLGFRFRLEDAQPFDTQYIEAILKDIRDNQLHTGDSLALPVYKGKTCVNYLDAVKNVLGLCYEVWLYESNKDICDIKDSQIN